MDQFNPYRTPQAEILPDAVSMRLHPLYLFPNYLFALLLLGATAILLATEPLSLLEPRGLATALTLYAPFLCFCLLRWGERRHLRFWMALQGLHVLWLMGKLLAGLASQQADLVVGGVLVGINLLALLGAMLQASVLPPVKEQP